jgi:uncharacterized membrane protein
VGKVAIDSLLVIVYCFCYQYVEEVSPMEKTSTGLEANVAGLLCYVLCWVSGLVFILIEKENKFVRFHAVQSIAVFGALTVVQIILGILMIIPYIGLIFVILYILVWILWVILWIVLMVKAYQGTMFKLPWAGNFAEEKTK